MIVKNITAEKISINKSVQIDVYTPDVNDGYILAGQTLDLSVSMSQDDLFYSDEIKEGIMSGALIFIVENVEVEQSQSIEIYNGGTSQWAKTFDSDVAQSNLFEGLASGFIYAKNCLIG